MTIGVCILVLLAYLGFECSQEKKHTSNISINSESERCSLSRAKSEIIDICRSNDFKFFVTLTINSKSCDRFSLESSQEKLLQLLKEYQRRCKRNDLSFKYIIVTEKHLNGAYHFHGLFTCFLVNDIIYNKNDYPTSKFFSEKLGHFSFSPINNLKKCSFYISKYINKAPIKSSTNRLYFCSKGLSRPEVFRLPVSDEILNCFDEFWGFDNKYVKIKDFNYEKINRKYQLLLSQESLLRNENFIKKEGII